MHRSWMIPAFTITFAFASRAHGQSMTLPAHPTDAVTSSSPPPASVTASTNDDQVPSPTARTATGELDLAPREVEILSLRHRLPYHPGRPIPAGLRLYEAPNLGVIGGGLSLFAAMYAMPLISTGGDGRFVFPVVPPIVVGVQMIATDPCSNALCESERPIASFVGALAIVDGVAQLSGLGLAVWGGLHPRQWLARDAGPDGSHPQRRARWFLVPGAPNAPAGITLGTVAM